MKKRTWTIRVEGYQPFQMVLLDGALDYASALREERVIWSECEVVS